MDGTAEAVMALQSPRSKPVQDLEQQCSPAILCLNRDPTSSEEITSAECGWKAEKEATGIFSSSAFTNLQRAFQAKPHLFSMKMERLWFLPVGV